MEKDKNPLIRCVVNRQGRETVIWKNLYLLFDQKHMRTIWNPTISDADLFDKVDGLMFKDRPVADRLREMYPYIDEQLKPRKTREQLLAEAEAMRQKMAEAAKSEPKQTEPEASEPIETEKPKRGRKPKAPTEA